jgi:hypothetical protein
MARLGKRVRFRAGAPEHAKILRAHGLEVLAEAGDAFAPALAFPHPHPPAPGALA